ncbi:MAG: DUF2818 family protein [Sulfuricellaceae bacterium]|nr:DUF2818 family protein [Sulfuricellaceae bacterium]
MNASIALFLSLAVILANLPFFADRLLFVVKLKQHKHMGWHLLELVVLYFVVGGLSILFEQRMGARHPQNWEFYAVTACMFLVFAFPGVTYRYLWRHR